MPAVSRTLLLLVAVVAAALAFVFYGGVRFDSDFLAMYAAVHGLVNGISPYDEVGQAALLNAEYPGLAEPIVILPFGYPPWYVLLASPLGWLSPGEAGRGFMLLNIGWLLLGTWALSARLDKPSPYLAGLASLYLPVIGLVTIGQYTLPVYAGGALGLLALSRRQPWMLALAFLLLSFKWHVGLIPAVGLLALVLRDRDLARRGAGPTVAVFAAASALGLLLDPAWPSTYTRSVLALSTADVNLVCDTCSSLSWTVSQHSGVPASLPGAALLAVGGVALLLRGMHRDAVGAFAAVVALTLMALPYVRNYDFAVLALPLFVAAERSDTPAERLLVGAVWLGATLSLADRGLADEVLGTSALLVFGLLLAEGPRPTAADPSP